MPPSARVCLKSFLIPKPQLGNVGFRLAKLELSKQEKVLRHSQGELRVSHEEKLTLHNFCS